jgi:competence protein ComEC
MSKTAAYIVLVVLAANVGVWWNVAVKVHTLSAPTEMHFLDVGQGDAELIRTAAGNILVDAGRGSMGALRELDSILPITDRVIDVIVITHPQLDHIGGFPEILKRYDVRLIVHTGVEYTSAAYDSLMTLARARGIPMLFALEGEEIIAGGGRFAVLSPATLLRGTRVSEETVNDASVVMRYDEGGASALFTGDISAKIERAIAARIGDIDILKVSHHGSKYSSAAEFLRTIKPEFAIIEVGRNPYGHPAPETLGRLAAVGAQVFRTDLDGRVSVLVEGGRIYVSKAR